MYVLRGILLVAVSPFVAVEAAGQSLPASSGIRERFQQIQNRWVYQAQQLAAKCEANGQSDQVDAIRQLIERPDSDVISIPVLSTSGQPSHPDGAGSLSAEMQRELTRIRKPFAKELFELANAAYRAGDISFCYDLVREVIEHDPDHGPARGLLGYTKHRDQWVTPYAAGKLKVGQVWDPRFGWVTKSHLAHYENGERLWKGQWLLADEVAKYRQQWANAWEIETEHYLIKTNTTLERGVEFADKLEKLYAIFFRLFAGFFSPRDQMAVLFEPLHRRSALGKPAHSDRKPPKRFRVNFYRTREEYLDALKPYVKSGLEVTTGMYYTGTQTAYFYVHEQMDQATVIHEATHQLFSETREHRQGEGSRGNYWVLEGIACYMESFRDRGDRVELGSWDAPRLKKGRERILKEDKLVPIDQLVRLGMKDFEGPEVYTLYTESACLSHFFMHHDGGRYRDTLVKYIEEVYLGRANFQTLSDLIGPDYPRLDRAFREHVEEQKYK